MSKSSLDYSYHHRQNDCYCAQNERVDRSPPRRGIIFDKNRGRRRDWGLRWWGHRRWRYPRCFRLTRSCCCFGCHSSIHRETIQARSVYPGNSTQLFNRIVFCRCRRDAFCGEALQCRGERRLVHRRRAHKHGDIVRNIRDESPSSTRADRRVAHAKARVELHLRKCLTARNVPRLSCQSHCDFLHFHSGDRGVGQESRLRSCAFVADVSQKRISRNLRHFGFRLGVGYHPLDRRWWRRW
mmetsp:Transcript_7543/g.31367  ORF Transcript_7543/g.31367 Transcript_7543/m.31367 type:complete len:240 (-) Transcript_7543:309-1028(-)